MSPMMSPTASVASAPTHTPLHATGHARHSIAYGGYSRPVSIPPTPLLAGALRAARVVCCYCIVDADGSASPKVLMDGSLSAACGVDQSDVVRRTRRAQTMARITPRTPIGTPTT